MWKREVSNNQSVTIPLFDSRATLLAWFFIFTTAIPTAICHGEVTYMHKGDNHTACLFLTEQGYNHSLFQVRANSASQSTHIHSCIHSSNPSSISLSHIHLQSSLRRHNSTYIHMCVGVCIPIQFYWSRS
jgi:hypothetical protein